MATALVLLGYIAAGLMLGAIPANSSWTPSADGITIYIEDNGIHTDLVLPKRAAGVDLTDFAPARDIADPRYAANRWLAVGWGERGFFLGTPRWRDLSAATLLHAAFGSDETLLHVEHIPRPIRADDVRAVTLRPAEYRRLVAYVLASRADATPVAKGYGIDDAFYPAHGHYDALTTCNAWSGTALRYAGVRIGRWTPFPVTVLGWFAR